MIFEAAICMSFSGDFSKVTRGIRTPANNKQWLVAHMPCMCVMFEQLGALPACHKKA